MGTFSHFSAFLLGDSDPSHNLNITLTRVNSAHCVLNTHLKRTTWTVHKYSCEEKYRLQVITVHYCWLNRP